MVQHRHGVIELMEMLSLRGENPLLYFGFWAIIQN